MYRSVLNFKETQIAIKQVKDYFQKELAEALNLMRVTAPLMVTRDSGLNDCLNGTERPVQFDLLETKQEVQIVQSLAKWKRFALGKYGFGPGEGLYTDMNAVRRDEMTDALHSIYVDQWDWELVLRKEERNLCCPQKDGGAYPRALSRSGRRHERLLPPGGNRFYYVAGAGGFISRANAEGERVSLRARSRCVLPDADRRKAPFGNAA